MSRGSFLVSAKDIMYSKNILKPNSLLQEGANNDDSAKVEEDVTEDINRVADYIGDILCEIDALGLFQESREVSVHIAGQITYKSRKICTECCESEPI